MDDFEETKAGAMIGGHRQRGATLLTGLDPIIAAGSLAMTGAIATAAIHN